MSGVSRRGFMGVAAAAPMMAGQAAKSVSEVIDADFSYLAVDSAEKWPTAQDFPSMDSSAVGLRRQLVGLLRHRDEVSAAPERSYRTNFSSSAGHYDSLHSVSQINKIRMARERNDRLEREDRLFNIDREIDNLKKKLGILGIML